MLVNSILDLIGNTPMVQIKTLNQNSQLRMYLKLEKFNPGGSVKDRIAKFMIEKAETQGILTKDKIIIEPTSGNTGIGLALVCRVKGYDLILIMPETMTKERRQILITLGAQVVLSDGTKGMDGAQDLVHEIVNKNPERYFMPNQFANESNVQAHYETTATEIWRDTDGTITHFIAGIGTTGTLMGVSQRLKQNNPAVKVVAAQPEQGSIIPGLKNLQTQYVPEIWQSSFIDEVHSVNSLDAEETARRLALTEGIFVGPSSGAILHVALKKAKELDKGVLVAIAPDGGEKYLSTPLCDPTLCLECVKKFSIRCLYKDATPIVRRTNF
jgi:cysteine synthase